MNISKRSAFGVSAANNGVATRQTTSIKEGNFMTESIPLYRLKGNEPTGSILRPERPNETREERL